MGWIVMDLTESIIPKSDQINFEDLQTGTATYTIRTVTKGSVEQPFNFMLVETDKAYRPSKTMRKVIVAAWGPDATVYSGRRLTLYGEPSILFGGKKVGGLRIRAMSHIDGPLEVMAQTTRGKRETFVVQPLADTEPTSTANTGGLCIDSVDAAARVIRAMTDDQVKKLKALLRSDATSKSVLATELYAARRDWFAEDILREIEGLPA